MCGITGIFDTRGRADIAVELIEQMNQTQFHRGPDAGAVHVEPGLALGHRRLSIIDIAGSPQPMFSADRSIALVYNGEIYNFAELRTELVRLGHQFVTDGDTEVVIYAWAQWGEECVTRFRGMFALALWDRGRETLFLARDRMGIKPLYYSTLRHNEQLLFGSELKALLAHPGLERDISPQAVDEYFAYGYVPEPKTILRSVFKLPPGHTLTVKRGNPIGPSKRYWQVPFIALPALSVEDAGEELLARIKEAVDIRLVADVPLGAFLSGGVDSSAVVAAMAGLVDEPVKTCSISFGDPQYNEAEFAAQVAQRYGTDHRVEQVDPDDFSLIDKLGSMYDEPFADSSALPTYRVCELARREVTVALSGDGGDENLAGYRRYRWHSYEERMRALVPRGLRRPLFGLLGRAYPKADWAPKVLRAKSTFEALARDSVEGYFHSVSFLGDSMRAQLFSPAFRRQLQGYGAVEVLRRHAAEAPTDHPMSLVQYLDMKTYLPGDILTKVDRASMAHSLEVRVPLLDHKLMEWISGLPPEHKLKGREGKYVFKQALRSQLPDDILFRPKMGFAVPIAKWFRGPLKERVQQTVLGPVMADSGFFNVDYLTQLVEQHQSGRRDNSTPLWALLMFESFLRRVCV